MKIHYVHYRSKIGPWDDNCMCGSRDDAFLTAGKLIEMGVDYVQILDSDQNKIARWLGDKRLY